MESGPSSVFGDRNSALELGGLPNPSGGRAAAFRHIRDPIASFTGRTGEIERLLRMLRSATSAVAVLSGARSHGGIGKTELACRLALEAQASFPLQILVDLRGQSESPLRPELALEKIIRAFSPSDLHLPGELEPLSEQYRALLSGNRILVIADDARDAAQVRPLLPPPGSALLITSRSRLSLQGVPSYHTLELEPLPNADSAALLRTLCPRLYTAQAAELAARVGHLPLALQLLGNVLREDPTRQYPDLLQQLTAERARIETLRLGEGTPPELTAAIAVSWRSVDPWARSALWQLSVLNAAFDHEIAEAVIALPEHASQSTDVLRRLQKSHLLEHDPRTNTLGIHNLVRAFARNQSETTNDHSARARHADYCTRLLVAADESWQTGREGMRDALARFDRERFHIEAAQAWASERLSHDDFAAASCIHLALAAPALLMQRLPARTRQRWMETALVSARRLGDRPSEGRLLEYLGLCHRDLGHPQRALEFYEMALEVARSIGDLGTEALALSSLGLLYLSFEQPARALAYFESNLAIVRKLSDYRAEGVAMGNLGICHLELRQTEQAIAHFEQDLAIARALGEHRSEGRALGNLGLCYRLSGQPQRAIEYYDQHLKIARIVGDRRGESNSLWNRALALDALGRRNEAMAAAEAALRIREELGDPRAEKVRTALASWKSQPASK